MKNKILYKNAINAVNNLFKDTSVSLEVALDNMENVMIEVESLIQCLKEDIKRNEKVWY